MLFGSLSYGQVKDVVYSNCSLRTEEVVGRIKGDSLVITIDNEKLLNDFSIIAKESGLDIKYNRVEIRRASLDENSTLFGLYGLSDDGFANTAISLDLNNGIFSISKSGATITCSSIDCTGAQCSAINDGLAWICTACTKKGCAKTTTVVIKSFTSE